MENSFAVDKAIGCLNQCLNHSHDLLIYLFGFI